jgi:cell wall assembly regulator SMI1
MMQKVWQRFLVALAALSPDLVTRLQPGVDEAAFARAEQQVGIPLPEEVKAYFRVQNGSNGPLLVPWEFLSLEQACIEWHRLQQEPLPRQASLEPDAGWYVWQASWLPLLRAAPNYYIFFDLAEKREYAQASLLVVPMSLGMLEEREEQLFFHPQAASEPPHDMARTLPHLLENLIGALEQGNYLYDATSQRLRPFRGWPLPPMGEPTLYELEYEVVKDKLTFGERVAYPGLCCTPSTDHAPQDESARQQSIIQSFHLVREAVASRAPEMSAFLQAGASSDGVRHLEAHLGVDLPEAFKTWYSLCDGTTSTDDEQGTELLPLFDFWSWYDHKAILEQWDLLPWGAGRSHPLRGTYLMSADARIEQVWYHPRWVPFMAHGDGSLLCLDLAPTAQGERGQIIWLCYKSVAYSMSLDIRRMPPVVWVASSFRQFVATLAHDMLSGKYSFDPKSKMLWSQEGLAYMQGDENLRDRLKERQEYIARGGKEPDGMWW